MLDPPFSSSLQRPMLEALAEYDWLSDNALVYVESPADTELDTMIVAPYEIHKHRKIAQVNCTLLRYNLIKGAE